ncbi:unnamed protein product [Closterium sp. Naga37s-1]|nr:unnamed protein product [Closterium sp. Naga37s-1]
MAALEGKLQLLQIQRQLSAVRCQGFIEMIQSSLLAEQEEAAAASAVKSAVKSAARSAGGSDAASGGGAGADPRLTRNDVEPLDRSRRQSRQLFRHMSLEVHPTAGNQTWREDLSFYDEPTSCSPRVQGHGGNAASHGSPSRLRGSPRHRSPRNASARAQASASASPRALAQTPALPRPGSPLVAAPGARHLPLTPLTRQYPPLCASLLPPGKPLHPPRLSPTRACLPSPPLGKPLLPTTALSPSSSDTHWYARRFSSHPLQGSPAASTHSAWLAAAPHSPTCSDPPSCSTPPPQRPPTQQGRPVACAAGSKESVSVPFVRPALFPLGKPLYHFSLFLLTHPLVGQQILLPCAPRLPSRMQPLQHGWRNMLVGECLYSLSDPCPLCPASTAHTPQPPLSPPPQRSTDGQADSPPTCSTAPPQRPPTAAWLAARGLRFPSSVQPLQHGWQHVVLRECLFSLARAAGRRGSVAPLCSPLHPLCIPLYNLSLPLLRYPLIGQQILLPPAPRLHYRWEGGVGLVPSLCSALHPLCIPLDHFPLLLLTHPLVCQLVLLPPTPRFPFHPPLTSVPSVCSALLPLGKPSHHNPLLLLTHPLECEERRFSSHPLHGFPSASTHSCMAGRWYVLLEVEGQD